MARAQMVRRTRTLAMLEAANIGWLAVVIFGLAGVPASPANVAGYSLVAMLLAEGTAYWTVKLRQLRATTGRPAGMAVFAVLRRVNPWLLAAGLVVIVERLLSDPGMRAWPGAACWLLAAAEHVNYFHVQLMYDTRADVRWLIRGGRLRRSHLATDLNMYRSKVRKALQAVTAAIAPSHGPFG